MDVLSFGINCHQCGFSGTKELRDAARAETCATSVRRKIRNLSAGEYIFRQGDEASGIYNLISGIVMIAMVNGRGGMFAPRIVMPGEAFGYRSSMSSGRHTSSAVVLRDSCFCQIAQCEARQLLDDDKTIRQALVNHCTSDILTAREEIIMHASMNLSERLLHFLVTKLLDLFGTTNDDGSARIQLPLKRTEIALALGVQGETLSRAIKRLEKSGLAQFQNKTVIIPSLRAVEDHLEEELSL